MTGKKSHKSSFSLRRVALFALGTIAASVYFKMRWKSQQLNIASIIASIGIVYAAPQTTGQPQCSSSTAVDLNWYPPSQTFINDLSTVINSDDVYNFIFNSSITPANLPYDTYNWCNMPHVRATEYQTPSSDFKLAYVEVVHRHHKRTPYQANTFPVENHPWRCDDEKLYYYGRTNEQGTPIAWSITQSPLNPFTPSGFPNSTCQFPQITDGGLQDSRQHGIDLLSVYSSVLHLLPDQFDPTHVEFHVTTNVITSQVAGEVISGMFPSQDELQVKVQPAGVDSLEPQYSCPASEDLFSSYGVGSNNSEWLAHLEDPSTVNLFAQLDAISGVNSSDDDWHQWFDHYFDNLSAKLCHGKALPCNNSDSDLCVTQQMADAVFRRGLYEYSYIYRDNPDSLQASVASFGVWVGELAHNIRSAMSGTDNIVYRHNVAHDGSVSRLLSILQLDIMVWPGMGSEVVFELWKQKSSGCWFVRVLWKGQPLQSSNPSLGLMDMVSVDVFLSYVDGLVGVDAADVPRLCSTSCDSCYARE